MTTIGDIVATQTSAYENDNRPIKARLEGLGRKFGEGKGVVDALGPMDMTIREGEFLSVVGPSGCGKSTLLRILAGLVRPSAGQIELVHRDPQRPLSAMVFQDYSIYPWKTVAANVALGLRYAGVRAKEREAITRKWLQRVGLEEFAKAYPQTLSGGMRQRVSIARALAIEPEMLLMDEPFAALDAQLRIVLQEELLALWQADKRTVVLITHSLDEAILLGDRVVVLSARPGRIVAEFEVPFERPRTPALRATQQFGQLEQEIWRVLREEVNSSLSHQKAGG
jgi:NitT/TauT family transport system ATP-binding protein